MNIESDQTSQIKLFIEQNLIALQQTFTPEQYAVLDQMGEITKKALEEGHKILLCGNGGSAADSQHIAAEFIGRFKKERKSFPAIALTTDSSILTCLANDYSYDYVFARQVEGLGQPGDILIGISTSGNSKNVLEAVNRAKAKGLTTLGFTGQEGGAIKTAADLVFCAQSNETAYIQSSHIIALHAICHQIDLTSDG